FSILGRGEGRIALLGGRSGMAGRAAGRGCGCGRGAGRPPPKLGALLGRLIEGRPPPPPPPPAGRGMGRAPPPPPPPPGRAIERPPPPPAPARPTAPASAQYAKLAARAKHSPQPLKNRMLAAPIRQSGRGESYSVVAGTAA